MQELARALTVWVRARWLTTTYRLVLQTWAAEKLHVGLEASPKDRVLAESRDMRGSLIEYDMISLQCDPEKSISTISTQILRHRTISNSHGIAI